MSNDLFDVDNSSPVIDPNKDYTVELVGEGKKFKDYAALARGKVEADHFVTKLQTELNEMRQELMSKAKLEEIVNALQKQAEPKPQEPYVAPNEPKTPVTDEDLEARVMKLFTEREAAKRKEDNVKTAKDALMAQFGDQYVDALKTKAAELGVEVTWFQSLAADNPKALLKLVGAENTPAKGNDLFTPPPASHQASFRPGVTERDKAYYDKIKTENPKLYWHKDTQVAMHKDAMRLGERFFPN
jgi:hypothetical protein